MNRRKFFKNSVLSAIGTAGLLKTAEAAEAAKSSDQNVQEYDIVVIGSGRAGLTTAIEAADLGAKVVVLEKCSDPSATRFMPAATSMQPTPGSRNVTVSKIQLKISTTI